MKKEELKYNVKNFVCDMIDDIMPAEGFLNKIKNATAKYWVEQNQWRLDEILSAFADKDGCIDEKGFLSQYECVLFEEEELRVSLKNIIPDNLKGMVPDKIVVFKKDDLYKLIGIRHNSPFN